MVVLTKQPNSGARRGSAGTRRVLLVPCIAVSLGLALLVAALLADGLPEDSSDAALGFVGGAASARRPKIAVQGVNEDAIAFMEARQKKRMRVTDQGSEAYEQMKEEKSITKTAGWNMYDSRGVDQVVGGDDWTIAAAVQKQQAAASQKQQKSGGGFELPSFSLPSFPAPAPPAPAPAQYTAPAPAPSPATSQGSGDSNPFAFLAELFGMTTTTTTTTPPPSPLESFLQGLGLR
mmetsp:Transcript_48264/g.121555  ORF Transcript_48264/g.121555 Transcript_48264/m.121555 type:complete len:234 (-) Transcript_48264:150-851(-)